MVHCWVTAATVLEWSVQSVVVVFRPGGLVLEYSILYCLCVYVFTGGTF